MRSFAARLFLTAAAVTTSGLAATSETAGVLGESTAEPFRIRVADHSMFASSRDPLDKELAPVNTLLHETRVEGGYGPGEAQIVFTNQLGLEEARDRTRPIVLEKKRLALRTGSFELDLGDTYQQIGRGIALALYRDPVFGLDTTLEGGAARYHDDAWELSAYGGRVNTLQVPVAVNPMPDPLRGRDVWLAAGQGSVRTMAGRFGTHYVVTQSRPSKSEPVDKRWQTGGVTYEHTFFDNVDVYAEQNVLVTDLMTQYRRLENGWAGYAAVTWAPLPWKVKLETKDYRRYFFDLRRPPTLEEDVVVSLNTQDVSAGKMTLERRILDGRSAVWASYLHGDDRLIRTHIHHGVVGSKWKIGRRQEVEARVGFRDEMRQAEMVHASLQSKWGTWKGESVEVGLRKMRWRRGSGELRSYEDRNFADLAYNFSERWNVGLGYQYVPSNPADVGAHFANAAANYKDGSFSGRAFVGQTSGGTQCSGGICRQLPPFLGAYVETVFTL